MIKFQKIKATTIIVMIVAFLFILSGSIKSNASTNTLDTKKIKNRVLVVSLPRVTWEILQTVSTPNIDKLIDVGSVADLSVRTLGGSSNADEGYATISAGSRAVVDKSLDSDFVNSDEIFDGMKAREIFIDQRGVIKSKSPAGLGLGFEKTIRANSKSLNITEVGTFSDALYKNNKSIAVFGNADSCLSDDPNCFNRSIAYVGTNSNGVLVNGDVTRGLLKTAKNNTTQLSLDNNAVAKKVKESLKIHDINVVECSDLERVEDLRTTTRRSISDANFINAIKKCDELIGSIMTSISLKDDQVYLISASSPKALPETTIFIAAGKDIPRGYASSSTTRHIGLVSLVDIAPTILKSQGIATPDAMGDTLLDFHSNKLSSHDREKSLQKINSQAVARDAALKPAVWTLLIIFIATVLVSLIAFTRAGKWRKVAKYLSLITLSYPLSTYIMQPFTLVINGAYGFLIAIGLVSILCATLLVWLMSKWNLIKVILFLSTTYLVVQIVDILFDGKLQFNSIFGNATINAGRFAGWGNSAFSFVAIFSFIFVAMVKESTLKNNTKNYINLYLILFLIIVLAIDGAPFFGSDVGGVLALTPGVFVLSMMLYKKRVGIKSIILSTLITLGAISAFALIDLSRPISQRTHLGRFADSLIQGEALITIERKMAASIKSFNMPTLYLTTIVALLFVVYITLSKQQLYKKMVNKYDGINLIILPGIIVAILGMLLNDSGLSIPALMLTIFVPFCSLFVLETIENEN